MFSFTSKFEQINFQSFSLLNFEYSIGSVMRYVVENER